MFTGWGIRTLSSAMGGYNPLSCHNGSVWPHDTAICVAGLMRYGFIDPAQRIASGLLEAAAHFDHRLPELFCGFSRTDFDRPVPCPTSCSPQAWASAAPLLLLRSLLRFEPQLDRHRVWCSPVVPERFLPLNARHVRLGEYDLSIEVRGDDWQLAGLEGTGVQLLRHPRPPNADHDTHVAPSQPDS